MSVQTLNKYKRQRYNLPKIHPAAIVTPQPFSTFIVIFVDYKQKVHQEVNYQSYLCNSCETGQNPLSNQAKVGETGADVRGPVNRGPRDSASSPFQMFETCSRFARRCTDLVIVAAHRDIFAPMAAEIRRRLASISCVSTDVCFFLLSAREYVTLLSMTTFSVFR